MKNLRLVCRPHQGPERRVLISVPDYSAITAVAAEKLGVAGSDILIQIKADGDDDLWEVDASFWGGIENGQTLFAAPVAGAASSSSSAAAVNTRQSSDSTHTKRKRKESKTSEASKDRAATTARDSDADESSSNSARPSKRAATSTPRQHTPSQNAVAPPPQASSSASRLPSSSSSSLQPFASSARSFSQQPTSSWRALSAKDEKSSSKRWSVNDDQFLWTTFRQRLEACYRNWNMPSSSTERDAFFQQIINDHGTGGTLTRRLVGRTVSSIKTRLRAKVKSGVEQGHELPSTVLDFFGMLRTVQRTTGSAESVDGRGQRGGVSGSSAGGPSRGGAGKEKHYVVVDDNDSDDDDEEYSTDGSESSHATAPRSSVVLSRSAIAATPSASSSRQAGPSNSQPASSSRSSGNPAVPVDALRPVGFDAATPQSSMRKSTVSSSATRPALPPHPRPLAPPAQHPFAPRPPATNGSTTAVRGPPSANPAATTIRGTPTHTIFSSNESPQQPAAVPRANGSAAADTNGVAVKEEPETEERDELQSRDGFSTPSPASRQPPPSGPPPPRPPLPSGPAQREGARAPNRPPTGPSNSAADASNPRSRGRAGPARWGNLSGLQFDLDFEGSRPLKPEDEPFTPCAGAHPEDVVLLRMALDEKWYPLRRTISQAVTLSRLNKDAEPDLDDLNIIGIATMLMHNLCENEKKTTRKIPIGVSPDKRIIASQATAMCAAACLSLALAVFDCAPPSWSVRRTSFAIAGYIAAVRNTHKKRGELKSLLFIVAERVFWAMGCVNPDKSSLAGPRGGAEHQRVHLCQDNAEDAAAAVIVTVARYAFGGPTTQTWTLDQLRGVSTLATTPPEELYLEFWNSTGRTIEGTSRSARDAAAALLLSRFTALLRKLEASVSFTKRCSIPVEHWGASQYVLRSMAPAVPGAVRSQLMAASQDASGRGRGGGTQALTGYVGQRMEVSGEATAWLGSTRASLLTVLILIPRAGVLEGVQ